MTETTDKDQKVTVKAATGGTVEITLERWIRQIIRESHDETMIHCPYTSLLTQERLKLLEWEIGIAKWVGSAVGLMAIAHMFYTFVGAVR